MTTMSYSQRIDAMRKPLTANSYPLNYAFTSISLRFMNLRLIPVPAQLSNHREGGKMFKLSMDGLYKRQGMFPMTEVEFDVESDTFLQDEEEQAAWLTDFQYKGRVRNFDS